MPTEFVQRGRISKLIAGTNITLNPASGEDGQIEIIAAGVSLGTTPSTQAFGDAAAGGSATDASKNDHKHAMMAAPTTVSGNAGTVTNGVYTTDTGTVTNTMLAGSIASSKLLNAAVANLSGTNTGDQTLPVKATGAEINTGTDDAKFATSKAITDSNVAFLSDIPAQVTDATIATSDITTNNATTVKHGWMPKGTGSTSTFFRSDMTQAAPTASVAITEAEIDIGTTPIAEAEISVTDVGVTTGSKIIGGVAYKAPTGKDLDELEMDALEIKFEPLAGSLKVHIKGLEGYIADAFKIWYTFA